MNTPPDNHRLTRPSTIRRLWIGFAIVLALTVLAEFGIHSKGYFGVDDFPGFGAAFGFFACVSMVLVAKALGLLLKRSDDQYPD